MTRKASAIAVVVTGAIVVAALIGGVRSIAYAALAALIVAGLWPVLLLLGGMALLTVVALVIGFVGETGDTGVDGAGEGVARGGMAIASRYYRFVGASRHPVLWGVAGGLVAGTSIVWGVLALWVIPAEHRTLKTLFDVQSEVEDRYRRDGSYPAPGTDETVPATLWSGTTLEGPPPIKDGFGRPIRYRVDGAWKIASYRISSFGSDGRPSDDDLCVTGGTRAGAWLARASTAARSLWQGVEGNQGSWREKVEAVETSRCTDR